MWMMKTLYIMNVVLLEITIKSICTCYLQVVRRMRVILLLHELCTQIDKMHLSQPAVNSFGDDMFSSEVDESSKERLSQIEAHEGLHSPHMIKNLVPQEVVVWRLKNKTSVILKMMKLLLLFLLSYSSKNSSNLESRKANQSLTYVVQNPKISNRSPIPSCVIVHFPANSSTSSRTSSTPQTLLVFSVLYPTKSLFFSSIIHQCQGHLYDYTAFFFAK